MSEDDRLAKLLQSGSHWHDYEPEARAVAEKYHEVLQDLGFTGPVAPAVVKAWGDGARDWVRNYGESLQVLEKTMRYMRDEGINIISPRSCIKWVPLVSISNQPQTQDIEEYWKEYDE